MTQVINPIKKLSSRVIHHKPHLDERAGNDPVHKLGNIEEVSKINNILYGVASKAVKLVQTEIETAKEKNSVEQIDQDKKKLIKLESLLQMMVTKRHDMVLQN